MEGEEAPKQIEFGPTSYMLNINAQFKNSKFQESIDIHIMYGTVENVKRLWWHVSDISLLLPEVNMILVSSIPFPALLARVDR